ncbi:LysR family transcriptional regulator [Pseudochelatococcus sp. B33]
MNLRHLEVIRAVMRARSTVGAAHDLGMSQPAVSNAIKAAETNLGFALFRRQNRRLIPTDEAYVLMAEAEPLFLIKESISQIATRLKAGRRGSVKIVATSELSDSLLPATLARFLSKYQGIEITLETLPVETLLEYVAIGACDVGFAMRPPDRHNLEFVHLADLNMVCAFHQSSPLVGREYVTPADLLDLPLISTRGMARKLIEDAFIAASVPFLSMIDVRFMNIAANLSEQGLGTTFMDALTASGKLRTKLRSAPFRPMITIPLKAIVSSESSQKKLIAELINCAKEEVKLIIDDPQTRQ